MATDLCKSASNQILVNNYGQSFRITAKAFKLLGVILHFMYFFRKVIMCR